MSVLKNIKILTDLLNDFAAKQSEAISKGVGDPILSAIMLEKFGEGSRKCAKLFNIPKSERDMLRQLTSQLCEKLDPKYFEHKKSRKTHLVKVEFTIRPVTR